MPQSPPPIVALPTPPEYNNRDTFVGLAYNWSVALGPFSEQVNTVASITYANAQEAESSAVSAAADKLAAANSAAAAASSAVAATWANTGATYAIGDLRKSPNNGRIYRRLTASNAGTTDPVVDIINWAIYTLEPLWRVLSSNYAATAGDALLVNTTTAVVSITLPASPSANDVVRFADYAGTFGANNLVFLRNGKNIMGLAEDYSVSTSHQSGALTYIDTLQGWKHL